jgi:putative transposase
VQISSKTEAHSQKNSTKQSSRDRNYTKKRLDYWESIRDVLADDLVFVDEMGVLLGLRTCQGLLKGD